MTAPIEILVEITAQEADASATPPVEEVILRGSERGKVLSNGKSYANFLVYDAQITQRANFFGVPGRQGENYLEVSYEQILALHALYTLSGKAVLVRVGQGDDDGYYNKPSTGTDRASCYVWRGFVPSDWVPSPSQDRSRCRLFLAEPLAYKSFPVLSDRVTEADYPRAPARSIGLLFPILFGDTSDLLPGGAVEFFPMICVSEGTDSHSNRNTWALGNLPLEDDSATFHDVVAYPYNLENSGDTYSDNPDYSKGLWTEAYHEDDDGNTVYVRANRLLWTASAGIATSSLYSLPSVSDGSLIKAGGHVLYWLLRYKVDEAASSITEAYFYGTNAPYQLKSHQKASVFYMVDRAIETATLLSDIANEFLVVLRRVDGTRQSTGMTPVWSISDRAIKKPSEAPNPPLLVDPGWLVRDSTGQLDIRELGVHPLYANSAQLEFGRFPLVTGLNSRSHYLDAALENSADQTENGIIEKRFSYTFCSTPQTLLGDVEQVDGLCSDRWGRWTKDDPVSLFGFSFRLPMGDILIGDMLDFGHIANGSDDKRRYYFIEQTQLNWQLKQLVCLASRFRDRPPIPRTASLKTIVTSAITWSTTRDLYPLRSSSFQAVDTPQMSFASLRYGSYRAAYYRVVSSLDLNSLRVRMNGEVNNPARFRLYYTTSAPPTPASPWSGWGVLSDAVLLYDIGTFQNGIFSFDYTLTDQQLSSLAGKYLFITADRQNSTDTLRSRSVGLTFDIGYNV